MERRNVVKGTLWLLTGMALVVAVARFVRGLGATTNLNDSTPWGFWIGFDVISGVALAAGGFVMAATVYIFKIEKFRPFVRPAVLTAFLGYLAVAIGLTFDLGLPWNIWHPMIYWQHHSVLFEVAMCVMLYLTVLGLEFAPVALEHKLARNRVLQAVYKQLKALTIPLVIIGIMLSTLHQSSLGSLFVIVPHRVHPLWYSPGLVLPANFFISAIGLGFMMVALEHFVSAWVYKHRPRADLLSGLSKFAALTLLLYGALRIGDLFYRGVLPGAIDGSWQSWLFIFEMGISVVIPVLLLAAPRLRQSPGALFTASVLVVLGMVMYRLDTALITMKRWPGTSYFPSMIEIMVSVGIISGLALVFMYFVENLEVFPESMRHEAERELETADDVVASLQEEQRPPRGIVAGTVQAIREKWVFNWDPFQKPRFFETTRVWLGNPLHDGARRYSMLLILAVAITAAVLPESAIFGFEYDRHPARETRTVLGDKGLLMKIDGNLEKESVVFDHEAHKEMTGGEDGCIKCHHMNYPESIGTSCSACHSDMYLPATIFDHGFHQEYYGGNDGCIECHPNDKDPANAAGCASCHPDMYPDKDENERAEYTAPSYTDAMHGNCETCHLEEAEAKNRPEVGLCSACHEKGTLARGEKQRGRKSN